MQLIHKLNQEQYPLTSRDSYQVPDLLAVFEYKDQLIPVLIEVKTNTKQLPKPLTLRSKIFKKLKDFARLLELPLLIAWKFRFKGAGLSFWFLFDAEVFTVTNDKFQVTFETASKENLLGQLVGDRMIGLEAGSSLEFQLSPLGGNWKTDYLNGNDLFGEIRVFGTDKNGKEISNINEETSRGLWSILQCLPIFAEYYSYTTASTVNFGWKLDNNHPLFLHQIMPIVLSQEVKADGNLGWIRILRENHSIVNSNEIVKAAKSSGLAKIVLGQIPNTKPSFLK